MTTAIIFDTETARLNGDIIQAAYINIQIDDGEIHNDGSYSLKSYHPTEAIDFDAMAVHNIIPDDLRGCYPSTECRIPKGINYIIGHAIDYDMDALFRAGQSTCANRICTLAIMRYLYPNLSSHKLGVLCYRFSENLSETRDILKNAHNALADCYATQLLVEHIVKQQEIKTFEELYQLSETARIPTHFYWGKFKGHKISSLDTDDLLWILTKERDYYVRTAVEIELDDRDINYDDPF